jgi:hypothetical protein
MTSPQTVIDCANDSCIAANADFFGVLTRSLCTISPLINDLERALKRSILVYARDLTPQTLKRMNGFWTDKGKDDTWRITLRRCLRLLGRVAVESDMPVLSWMHSVKTCEEQPSTVEVIGEIPFSMYFLSDQTGVAN